MVFLLTLLLSLPSQATEIRVAAAADLKSALPELTKAYERAHPGDRIVTIFGASGQLLQQIENGASFDLFLSADAEKPEQLVKERIAKGDSFVYAKGFLVAWVPKASKLVPAGDLQFLKTVKHVAIASPKTAPYGTIAEAALKNAKVLDSLKGKLATAENIAQTAQYVTSGAAEVGLISKSLASSEPLKSLGRSVDVSPELYTPLKQSGVVLTGKAEAIRFKDFLLGEFGRKILAAFALTTREK